MALHSTADRPPAPRWLTIARSALLSYLRLLVYAVAGIFALFGGVQLAATRQGSVFVTCVAGTVLLVAALELVAPGVLSRDSVSYRLARQVAAVPVVLTWLALAVVIGANGGAAIAHALDALRALVTSVAVSAFVVVVTGVVRRDPYMVPAFRTEK